MRRCCALFVSAMLAIGLLASSPAAGNRAQAASSSAPKATTSYPIRGQSFSVAGRLSTRVARPVVLQRKVGSEWKQVAAGETNAKGAYSFEMSTSAAAMQLRVVAKRVKIGKKTYQRTTSKATKLRTVSVTPATPIAGERFTVAESLPKKGIRPVELQRKVSSRWLKISSAKTTATGSFKLSASLPTSSSLRVVAPKAKVGKKKYSKLTLKTFRVNTSSQSATISLPTSGVTNQALVATVKFTPARAGRPVELQQLAGAKWTTVATGSQDSAGSAVLATTPAAIGTFQYRGVTTTHSGAAAATTSPKSVAITAGTAALSIVVSTPASAVVGEQFIAVLVVAGGTAPYSWTATGLPAGIELTSDGKLAGRPTTPGTYTTHLTASDTEGRTAETDLQIVVTAAVEISIDSLPAAVAGDDYDATLTGTGGTAPYTWSATGLPSGITLSADGNLHGTTTEVGVHQVTLTLTDTNSRSTTKVVTFAVTAALEITTSTLPSGLIGTSYSTTMAATGGTTPYTWAATGLPAGLTLDADGVLSGTPTTAGTYETVAITVTDDDGTSITATLTMSVSSVRVDALASGESHTCALTNTGGVRCWGYNNSGQLGNGTTTTSTSPVNVTGLTSGVTAVATGAGTSCAITSTGGLKCWGSGTSGQLGTGDTTSRLTPTDVTGLTSGVAAVAVGTSHTCALTSSGGVKCWGIGARGQLGNGSLVNTTTPSDVTGLTSGVTGIAAGFEHTCALTGTGGVKCWGRNNHGQIGISTAFTLRATPADVTNLTSGASAIAANGNHSCAITDAGGILCWGNNDFGQLGNNTTTSSSTPVEVTGLASGVAAVAPGASHSCALTDEGATKCWGRNDNGQLGNDTTTNATTPVQVAGLTSGIATIASGSNHSCAAKESGGVQCWGYDNYGQLGDGGGFSQPAPIEVTGLTGAATIASAGYKSCVVTSAGSVKCWGRNNYGQLGNGTTINSTSPVQVTDLTSNVTDLAAGSDHTCALTNSGGVKCWGRNNYGQLGNGTTADSSVPVQVTDLTSGITALASSGNHSCALNDSGIVKCWGFNNSGQLGNGNLTNSSIPVAVTGLSSGITAIAAGGFHSCAVTSAGGVQCWGSNSTGQLGNGTTTSSSAPVAVTGLASGIVAITAASGHTCAVTSAGGVKCWGYNGNGQLGNGNMTNSTTPAEVVGLASGVAAIATGQSHTCARTDTGAAKCWGHNGYGQLGDGTITTRSTQADVLGLTSGVTAIGAGTNFSCAVTNDSQVKCWGYNDYGQLGHNTTSATTPVDVTWPIS